MSTRANQQTATLRASESWQHVARQSFTAVCALALESGSLQERLEGACDALLSLESRQAPEPLREELGELIAAIMAVESPAALQEAEAATLARRILAFHERVLLI